jgi:hypothetical protein
MNLTRVAKTSAATIAHTFYLDETATDATGAVTYVVTDATGAPAATGPATHGTTGVYSFVLPGQAALKALTVAWSGTLAGTAVTELDFVEIVGGHFFGLAEGRASDPTLADTVKYPTADLITARLEVEVECEEICGRAFVPRYRRVVLDGNGTGELTLPDADVRTIRSVTMAPRTGGTFTALTAGQLVALSVGADSMVRREDGGVWTEGRDNVVVEYEFGLDAPPRDLARAAKTRLRSRLNAKSSGIPERAMSISVVDGMGTYQLSTPGAWRTGIPDVDAAYARYSLRDQESEGGRAVPASRLLNFDPQRNSLFHGGVR